MKVYLVVDYDYEGITIRAAYASREQAEAHLAHVGGDGIDEHDVLQTVSEFPRPAPIVSSGRSLRAVDWIAREGIKQLSKNLDRCRILTTDADR